MRVELALATVCLSVTASCRDTEPDATGGCVQSEVAVLSVAEGLIAADNRHDLEGVLEHYIEDVRFIAADGELVEGRDAVRTRYEELFRSFDVDIQMESDEVVVGSEWAFVRGRNVGTLTSRTEEVVQALDDRFLMILRCEPALGWRISHLMWVHVS